MANEFALAQVLKAARNGMEGDVKKVGVLLTNAVKIKLSHPGTGATYLSHMRAGGTKRVYTHGSAHLHQASAPGEPPAVDTGVYRASWDYDVEHLPNAIVLRVGTGDKIGPWLEYGTSQMQARPHIRPAVVEEAPKIGPLIAVGMTGRESSEARRLGGRG